MVGLPPNNLTKSWEPKALPPIEIYSETITRGQEKSSLNKG
jgi:hypothetical protein